MKVIITGGGTAGHVYPGVAVAKELLARRAGVEILFVGAVNGVETRLVPQEGFAIETLDVAGIKGKGFLSRVSALAKLVKGVGQAREIMGNFKPDVILGCGGYASGPVGLAAVLAGTPLAVAEQNAAPGLTNRWLGKIAQKVFVTWPGSESFFPGGKGIVTGNPIRPEFFTVQRRRQDSRLGILVVGGSLGASSMNTAMMEAVQTMDAFAGSISVVHQTGAKDIERVKKAYINARFRWEASAFYADMPQRLADADIVISRAGAGAVAEICAVGRPAVYVPFPHAADDHQTKNAQAMAQAGAALVVRDQGLNGAAIAGMVEKFLNDRAGLAQMGESARRMARPHAAREIADGLMKLVAA
ncbi:MAG: undecaprenyldiphospho-muramoylpentapeptide beta-N-acetylglucosaminyltransferase [Nitrospinae bacterium]|nr:undecaprenyldiphospho-muramoylpentapeptide beta-N-acetylglucosaminyltransferase [Nitrospinota bacterium]